LTKIITLTANPAIDVSTTVGKIAPFTKLRCGPARHHPGGGGINVARVVKRLGGEVSAIYPAGGTAGGRLRHLIEQEGVHSLTVSTRDETREDFTVLEESTGHQYRFVLPGAALNEPEMRACLEQVAGIDPAPAFMVASGSVPPGMPEDFFARAADIAKQRGAKVIADTSGPPLKAVLARRIFMIKPNLSEFLELTGAMPTDDVSLVQAGRRFIHDGFVDMIALTRGPHGALLISRDQAWRADGLSIKPVSVVGAGDSFTGAMVWCLSRGETPDVALRYAVAAGSAALLSPGTELCRPEDVKRLESQVTVREIILPADGSRGST